MIPAENIIPLAQPKGRDARWSKTPHANIYRFRNDVYHVRAHVNGRLIRRSLKTRSLEIARIKAGELLAQERSRTARPLSRSSFGALAATYLARISSDPDLKQRAKDYRRETVEQIKRVAPALWDVDAVAVSDTTITAVSDALRERYSPTRYNGAVESLRGICAIAVEMGYLATNPAGKVERQRVPITAPDLPEHEQFSRLMEHLSAHPNRRAGAQSIRLLLCMGARIGAARLLRPEHIDWQANEVVVPAIKYDEQPTRLPLFPALRKVLRELLADYPGDGPLMPVANPRRTLATCCRLAGIAQLTPHHMRHLFATRCLESGVDVKTVASWLGHKDGGALLLKRYAHLRREHSQAMARKVKF
jgi:integrase